jgi:KEOPS complex subunit Pcc1
MKTKAITRLKFPSEKLLQTVFQALDPETKKPMTSRSKTSLEKKGMFLILRIEANDTVALRATINAYLRWINSMINTLEILEKR